MIRILTLSAAMRRIPLVTFLVTGLYFGRLKPASGTWGTLSVLPFAFILAYYVGAFALMVFAVLLCVGGTRLIDNYLSVTKQKDPSEVVIDEWAGMVIALIPAGIHPLYWLAAFALFRLFDAVKIGPVGYCDKHIKGARGVMMDDVVAGLMAAALLALSRYFA